MPKGQAPKNTGDLIRYERSEGVTFRSRRELGEVGPPGIRLSPEDDILPGYGMKERCCGAESINFVRCEASKS